MNEEPKSEFIIKRATRQGVVPLIGLYAESGCGKSMSALLLARGLVGPNGKIGMVDSESGRGSLYADVIEGGYDVLNLDAPFTPARYMAAQDALVAAGMGVIIYDSGSHEWDGIGSVLDMAADAEERSGKAGLHNWKTPKFEHAKFVQKLLQSPIPVIVCLRAKYKSRQKKDERGKTIIIKDEVTSPIQAEDFIFEMTAHAEILPDHSINLTKCSHPDLRKCFPEKGPITIEHGKLIAQWCANAGSSPAKAAQESKPTETPDDVKALKNQLWKLLKPVRGKESNWKVAQQWLIDEMCLDPELTVAELTIVQFKSVIAAATKKLGGSRA